MSFAIEAGDWIWVYIDAAAFQSALDVIWRERIGDREAAFQAIGIVRNTGNPRLALHRPRSCCHMRKAVGSSRQCVDEDVIIFFGLVVKIIASKAEIEWPCEMRCKSQLLA